MKHRLIILPLCVTLSALLSSCGTTEPQRIVTFATWKQQPDVVQPQVKVTPVRLDVLFAPGSDVISSENETALDDFLGHSGISNGATVDLAVAPPAAGYAPITQSRIDALKRTLARRGVLVELVAVDQSDRPDTVSVVGKQVAIARPACPGYNAPIKYDQEWQPLLVPGCSNTLNLEMMVANPADLAQGRTLPPADGEAATLPVVKYRAGQAPQLNNLFSAGTQ
jgi:pilus biogenesis lipoprotein CpaD